MSPLRSLGMYVWLCVCVCVCVCQNEGDVLEREVMQGG